MSTAEDDNKLTQRLFRNNVRDETVGCFCCHAKHYALHFILFFFTVK